MTSGCSTTITPMGRAIGHSAFPFPSGTLIGPSVAPDGTIYIFHSYTNLWSLTATGTKRWEADGIAGSNFPVTPTVSPNGSVIVFGTVFSFGVNGKLAQSTLPMARYCWTLPIAGPSAGMAGPVSFPSDGETVYAPITQIGGVNKLLAVSVNGGGSTGPTLTATGTCPGTATFTVSGATPGASVQIWASRARRFDHHYHWYLLRHNAQPRQSPSSHDRDSGRKGRRDGADQAQFQAMRPASASSRS